VNPPVSAAIITKNEEVNIERCLDSLAWVDEIVVVDSGSIDRTLEICERRNCRVLRAPWLGYGPNKRLAVNSTSNDWVLAVDADEEVTPELAGEIQEVLSRYRPESGTNGYKIRWRSMYLGTWIRHSGWSSFYKLKLFRKSKGNYTEDVMHETVKMEGRFGLLKSPLNHYTYPDRATVARKMEANTTLAAEVLWARGKRPGVLAPYVHGGWTFLRMYILKVGFLDGRIGLVLARDYARTVYLKYAKCRAKGRTPA
jgi:glycosyltransferase involved in cell wall biosynthesis